MAHGAWRMAHGAWRMMNAVWLTPQTGNTKGLSLVVALLCYVVLCFAA
jgi:hypothetical protein